MNNYRKVYAFEQDRDAMLVLAWLWQRAHPFSVSAAHEVVVDSYYARTRLDQFLKEQRIAASTRASDAA